MEYRTDMEPQEVIAKAARFFRERWPYGGRYSVKRDGVVLMKDMSFWQLLTSLITDRDGDEAVVVVPEDGRTTVSLSASRRDFMAALESWAEETFGEQLVLR